MNNLLNYLGQVSLIWLLLYVVYVCLLRHETFFAWNRTYLLVSALVALLLPFSPTIPRNDVIPVGEVVLLLDDNEIENEENITLKNKAINDKDTQKQTKTVDNLSVIATNNDKNAKTHLILGFVYFFGATILLLRFLHSIYQIQTLIRKFGAIRLPNTLIFKVQTDSNTPIFTFLNLLFWHESKQLTNLQNNKILLHELTHIRQGHGFDLLFSELLQIIFWFNPVAYYYKKSLQTTHEYLADKTATETKQDFMPKNEYAKLLVNQVFETSVFPLTHSFFNTSLLKQRIMMLHKNKSKKAALLKFTVAIPALLLCVLLLACEKEVEFLQSPEVEKAKALLVKYTDMETSNTIKTLIFDSNNKAKFTIEVNHYCTVKLASIDGNYDNLALKITKDGQEMFTHEFDNKLSGVLLLGLNKGSTQKPTINVEAEIIFKDNKQRNVVLLVNCEKFVKKAPEPNVAGFLLLEASKTEDSKEVAMSLRNDFDYTFTVTSGKAKIIFQEALGKSYKASKDMAIALSPQKDIGGYLIIMPENGNAATVTMDYKPRN